MLTVFGIKQCDTVKKALKWLDTNDVAHQFHDVRKDGLTAEMIQRWIAAFDWEMLVNKRSTTWRNLDTKAKETLGPDNIVSVLLENPTLIKRPIVEGGNKPLIGFKEDDYQANLL